jgi:alpha-2-macroglobulin-like protein
MKTESNILDAIESLIREPYGCFEQCSSVTYPLVMLLKYLKWAPKTDKTIKMV